ncbi:MAG: membrane-binding protein [Bacteroidetes bacterium]|nr:membrane-binding protein [Bacteroidota bacterium]
MSQYINTSILCCLILQGCNHSPADTDIPRVFVRSDDPALRRSEGVCWLGYTAFSGWAYTLYENGDTALVASYYEGKQHGIARSWYPSRRLKETRLFAHGRKTGEHKGWWEDGSPRFVYHFENDLYEGSLQEWYPGGQLYRSMHYHRGQEEGMQQIWRPDGALHANYAAVDGRNYGLTGTMHCKNVFPDAQ